MDWWVILKLCKSSSSSGTPQSLIVMATKWTPQHCYITLIIWKASIPWNSALRQKDWTQEVTLKVTVNTEINYTKEIAAQVLSYSHNDVPKV